MCRKSHNILTNLWHRKEGKYCVRKPMKRFLENKWAGSDVNVHPLVIGLFYLLNPIVKKNSIKTSVSIQHIQIVFSAIQVTSDFLNTWEDDHRPPLFPMKQISVFHLALSDFYSRFWCYCCSSNELTDVFSHSKSHNSLFFYVQFQIDNLWLIYFYFQFVCLPICFTIPQACHNLYLWPSLGLLASAILSFDFKCMIELDFPWAPFTWTLACE